MKQTPDRHLESKLVQPVGSLPFCSRTRNLLTRNGIETIIDMMSLQQGELLSIKGVGPTTMREIKSVTLEYLSSLIQSHSIGKVRQAVRALKCRSISDLQESHLPQDSRAPVSLNDSIETFTISTRARNALLRSGIQTVSDFLGYSEHKIRDIRYVGEKTYEEIRVFRQELEMELSFSRLLDSVWEREPNVDSGRSNQITAADAERLQASPCASIDTLQLSTRTRNALVNGGIATVGDLLRASDSAVKAIKNIGEKTLQEIQLARKGIQSSIPSLVSISSEPKLSLTHTTVRKLMDFGVGKLTDLSQYTVEDLIAHARLTQPEAREVCKAMAVEGLSPSSQWPEHPLIKSSDYQFLKRASIPLSDISISRLALPSILETRLWQLGMKTVDAIASQSKIVLETALGPHSKTHIGTIVRNLKTYFEWLLAQSDWNDEIADRGISPLYFVWLQETTLEGVLAVLFGYVPREKDRRVIRLRFGLDAAGRRTLQQIGDQLGVSRERVRQVEKRSLKRLAIGADDGLVCALYCSIENKMRVRGGLMTVAQIGEHIENSIEIGEVHLDSAVSLLLSLKPDQFVLVQRDKRWALTGVPVNLIKPVSRELVSVLKEFYAPLSTEDLADHLLQTKWYTRCQDKDKLSVDFIRACLATSGTFDKAQDDQWGLSRWRKRYTDTIVLALRKLGKPSHYKEITTVANRLLSSSQQLSERNCLARLQYKPELFIWVGRGTYGLAEWGLERPKFYVDIAEELLEQRGEPLTFEEIFPIINAERQASPESIKFMLCTNPRFHQYSGTRFGLASWLDEPEGREDNTIDDPFLEDLKRRFFDDF